MYFPTARGIPGSAVRPSRPCIGGAWPSQGCGGSLGAGSRAGVRRRRRRVARLLKAHIRCEEREIFPLVERIVPDEVLRATCLATRVPPGGPVEVGSLADPAGGGACWAVASADLNATLVAWPAGGGVVLHRNDERDVLVVVIAGGGTLRVDGRQIELHAQRGVMIPKGTAREFCAGPQGLRYLSIHLRRSGLTQIRP